MCVCVWGGGGGGGGKSIFEFLKERWGVFFLLVIIIFS